ncbi:MAG: FG-GAP-like repeat-containing protein [Vicingaceae bacterium]|nr:FG-GAP-like repeat-containing protein [Vicingaceae bacterium]
MFHTDETGSNVVHKASKNIKFLAGYKFTPSATKRNHSFIDISDFAFQNTYTGISDEMFDERVINTALPVGAIQGNHSVSATGAGTYTIEIQLPPGTNNLAPSLSLNYNSQNIRSGIMGVGWGIGGLSRIARTTSTYHHQTNVSPITRSTAGDQFELDGKRFSRNAFNFNTLQFENETYEKIAFATGGGFILETKEGLTIEYGTTLNSRYDNLFWNIAKITDNYGNFITYTYANNHIVEINYTGNSLTGLQPYNKIKFNYSTKEDIDKSYYDDVELTNDEILRSIEIFAEGNIVKTYQFNYDYHLYSYLNEIVQLGSDGSQLNSTLINYKEIGVPSNLNLTPSGVPIQNAEYRSGDFNGDGLADLIAFTFVFLPNPQGTGTVKTFQNYKLYINQGNGTFNEVVSNGALPANFFPFDPLEPGSQLAARNAGIESIDLNGDGLEDMLLGGTNSASTSFTYTPYYSIGNDFVIGDPIQVNASIFDHSIVLGDFEGNGKIDVFVHKKVNSNYFWEIHFLGGINGTNTKFIGTQYKDINNSTAFNLDFSNFVPIDFNGDGKTDILTWRNGTNSGATIFTFNNFFGGNPMQEIYTNPFIPSRVNFNRFGDFNGDGKTDVLTSNGFDFFIHYSSGKKYEPAIPVTSIAGLTIGAFKQGYDYFVLDFNGDGKADIIRSRKSSFNSNGGPIGPTYYDIFYSNGTKFNQQSYFINEGFNSPTFEFADFDGNGSNDIFIKNTGSSIPNLLNKTHLTFTNTKLKLSKIIKDGFNNTTQFEYHPLTNSQGKIVYAKENNAQFPVSDIQAPLYVVSAVETPDGIGGVATTSYFYEGAKFHRTGKGFLGFAKISNSNVIQNRKLVTEFEFDNVYFHVVPKKQAVFLINGTPISENTFVNTIAPRFTAQVSNIRGFMFFLSQNETITSTDFLLNHTVTSNFTYDAFGNIMTTNTTKGNIETIAVVNQYDQFGTHIPARLISSTATITRTGNAAFSKTIEFQYNNEGYVTLKTENVGTPFQISTTFSYNAFGNNTNKTISTSNAASRSTAMTYDTKGRYPEVITNVLGQSAFISYDAKWGVPLTSTSIDGLTTLNEYDAFGRPIRKIEPGGITTETQLIWDIGGGMNGTPTTVENSIFKSVTDVSGSPTTTVWFDGLGRKRKTEVNGFNKKIVGVTSYDERGNMFTITAPFFEGDVPIISTQTYDNLNRLVSSHNSAGTTTTNYLFGFEKLTTTITLPDNTSTSTTKDATGLIIEATDLGGTLTYDYFSSGLQKSVKLDGVTMVSSEYDLLGNQTKLIDKNAGTTTYEYTNFNQLTKQTNANQKQTTLTYDVLGRITTKTNLEGTTTYTYVTNGNGLNQLQTLTNTNGTSTNLIYDNLNRITEQTDAIGNESFTTVITYDAFNNIASTTYPSGFKTINQYNGVGFPTKVIDATNSDIIWEAQDVNAFNQYTQYKLGNGVTTSKTFNEFGLPETIETAGIQHLTFNFDIRNGNLLSREDLTKGLLEEFTYDNLNRLTQTQLNGVIQLQQNYANNGNILAKTDAGNYTYSNAKVNAVLEVDNPTADISLMQQDITYTTANKTASITENDFNLLFTYNANNERIKTELTENGSTVYTRFFNGNYEKQLDANNVATEVHYINGGDGLAALYVIENGTGTYYYAYTDYLGSLLTLTDANGSIVAEQNFDAWGRNRNPQDWTYSNLPTNNPNWLWRGYTSHEHLPEFALINMNGRMYDPVLGRMLSPDNFVQDPFFTQNFNRYSYVLNNPLKFTDPSGEIVWMPIIIGAMIGAHTGYKIGEASGATGLSMAGHIISGVVLGGAAGSIGSAAGGAIAGANFAGASATGALVGGAASGAISGGGFTALSGGNVGQGMLYGAVAGGAGGFVGGAVGGAGGAFAGGATSGYVGSRLYGGSHEQALGNALIGGAMGLGTYELSTYINYKTNYNGNLNYGGYRRVSGAIGRANFWEMEAGWYELSNGGVSGMSYGRPFGGKVNLGAAPANTIYESHTHARFGLGNEYFGPTDMSKIPIDAQTSGYGYKVYGHNNVYTLTNNRAASLPASQSGSYYRANYANPNAAYNSNYASPHGINAGSSHSFNLYNHITYWFGR